MMGLLIKREVLPYLGARQHPLPPRILRPSETWMGVYVPGDVRVGFVNTTTTPGTRNGSIGTSVAVTSQLKLLILSIPMDIYIAGTAWLPQDQGLAEFNFQVRSAEHTMSIAATVKDGQLEAKIYTGGEEIPFRWAVSKDLLVSAGMGTTTLNVPALNVGQEVLVDTFDPMTLSAGKARVKCTGEETLEVAGAPVRTKIVTTDLNGITSKAWVDENEEIVRAETPFGFSLRKITAKEALEPLNPADSSNLIGMVAIRPTGKTPFRGAKRLVVRFSGLNPQIVPPTDERQTAAGGQYTIVAPEEPTAAQAAAGPGLEQDLASDALIQADNPKIKDLAATITGTETDAWRKARLVYEWVYTHIKKKPVFSIPSAIEVLETGEGDCNEHAVLYTALARAAGIPTRIAIGVVWSDDLAGFYYHAWPEVCLGRWIAIDPTLGQPVADATHIKFLTGDIKTWPQLIPYIGQVRIAVASVE